ncbi:MAG: helix-turn-helix transcriptional regulator [Clostridia bacterium]|nr:helix-turn-helix transcriptional regulator [Clostridia bacterium]
MAKEIKNILRDFREKHNYSVKELAYYFGNNENLIVGWESGVTEPTVSECLILSKLYGITLDEMFFDFDVKAVLPSETVDSFEHQVMLNQISARWYN